MKNYNGTRFMAALAGLALLGGASALQAQTPNYVVDTFDADDSGGWTRWWGGADQTYSWDGSVDAKGSASSGSLKAAIGFDIAAHGGDNQFALQHYFGATLDGTQYTNFVFDVKFDTNSPTRLKSGDFGYWEFGLIASDYSQIFLDNPAVTAKDGNWIHVASTLDPSTPKLGQIIGVAFKCWAGDTGAGADNALTGTMTFWLDNVELLGNTNVAPAAPPTMTIAQAPPGLQLFASQPGAQYQRQSVRLQQNTGLSWVGAPAPVTYSVTIAGYPSGANAGFQTQIFLVPGASIPTYETSPDWNEPNVVFLDIENRGDGGATATLHYKTNLVSGNSMYYNTDPTMGGVGNLGNVSSSSPLGTWSMTFANNTNITLTAPGGATTSLAMPADAAALFADPMYVYVGDQPNQAANIGLSALYSDFRVLGGPTGTNELAADHFATDTSLDTTATWQLAASDAAGVVLVPPTSGYWVTWSTPANGFSLQASPKLKPAQWTDAVSGFGVNPPTQIFKSFATLIPKGVPTNSLGFFELVNTNSP